MAKGPALTYEELEKISNSRNMPDTSFRMISTYIPSIDRYISRIDIISNKNQYHVAFNCIFAPEPKYGEKLSNLNYLIKLPNLDCVNVLASKNDIIEALEELLKELKNG